MTGQRSVTILAGIVDAAALHLDRNNVYRLVVMRTSRLGIETDSAHIGMGMGHSYRVEDP